VDEIMLDVLKTANSRSASWLCLMVDILLTLVCLIVGVQTGKVGYFFAASGLALLAPVWFRHPISLKMPIFEQLRQHREHDRMSVVLTGIGFALILIAAIIGWVY